MQVSEVKCGGLGKGCTKMADKMEVITTKREETFTSTRVVIIVKNFPHHLGDLKELAEMNDVPDKAWFETRQGFLRMLLKQYVVVFSWWKPYEPVIKDLT